MEVTNCEQSSEKYLKFFSGSIKFSNFDQILTYGLHPGVVGVSGQIWDKVFQYFQLLLQRIEQSLHL